MAPVFMISQKAMFQMMRGVVGDEDTGSSLLLQSDSGRASPAPETRREREGSTISMDITRESSSSDQSAKKRKRASKPKVRTGCITCKIRRVKCGEEKPACLRCTSTGRTCDGYESQASVAKQRLQVQHRPLPSSSAGNPGGLRVLRPLVASIEGTDTERMYFHTYRRIVEEGMAQHVANVSAFWRIAIPQMCHMESPIKHAYVALGAALQSFQRREKEQRDNGENSLLTPAEVFTLDHYSRALSLLHQRADPEMADHIDVVLLCCLAFVYIETLRDNVRAALTHLTNGLRIVDTLPDETLAPLADLKGRPLSSRWASPPNPRMLALLSQLAVLEISACVFAQDFKPVISLRLLEMRKLDESSIPEFCNVTEVHQDVGQFARDTFAMLHHSRSFKHDPDFWVTGTWGLQRDILFSRMQQIRQRLIQFTKSSFMPRPRTQNYCSMLLDLLHFQCMEMIVISMFPTADMSPERLTQNASILDSPIHRPLVSNGMLPGTTTRSTFTSDGIPIDPALLNPNFDSNAFPGPQSTMAYLRRMEDLVILGEAIKKEMFEVSSPMQRDRWLMLDVGVNPPMHYVVDNCPDPILRERAMNVMRNRSRRENLWDGDKVNRLRNTAARVGAEIPKGMFNTVAVTALYEQLGDLKLSDEDAGKG